MKVSNVLESLPGVGKVRAQKLMEELDISASRRVRGLGAKQREMLLEKFEEVTGWPLARGRLFVIAGPSGVGKGSVVQRLLARRPRRLASSVSATTRAPRASERDGVDYRFVSDEEFDRLVAAGELLEWAAIFGPPLGDPRAAFVERRSPTGRTCSWRSTSQGARQVREQVPGRRADLPGAAVVDELERRLRTAGTEDEEQLARRLGRRRGSCAGGVVRPRVVNDDVERAATRSLLSSRHPAPSRRRSTDRRPTS